MISEKVFCDTIRFMKDRNDSMTAVNKVFTKEFDDSVFHPYFKYENQMVKVLANAMKADGEWIDYFCWELDFGTRWAPGTITEKDGTDIPLGTPEDLYRYLLQNYRDDLYNSNS